MHTSGALPCGIEAFKVCSGFLINEKTTVGCMHIRSHINVLFHRYTLLFFQPVKVGFDKLSLGFHFFSVIPEEYPLFTAFLKLLMEGKVQVFAVCFRGKGSME